jgi:hypothetical protein
MVRRWRLIGYFPILYNPSCTVSLLWAQADDRNASLAEENGNLILELQSRPSVKQLRDSERRADQARSPLGSFPYMCNCPQPKEAQCVCVT